MHDSPAPLNLPESDLLITESAGARVVFDPVRKKYVRLTPEEWVRQNLLQYLVRTCGYPSSLIAVEMSFRYQRMARRADIVVHDRSGKPFLMAECKSPSVEISQDIFDQVSRYNRVVHARYLAVSNGRRHFCWEVDEVSGTLRFLDALPPLQN